MPDLETTSVSTPIGLAISEWRLKWLAAALWWLLGRHLNLGRGLAGTNRDAPVAAPQPMTMRSRGKVARQRTHFPISCRRFENSEQRGRNFQDPWGRAGRKSPKRGEFWAQKEP